MAGREPSVKVECDAGRRREERARYAEASPEQPRGQADGNDVERAQSEVRAGEPIRHEERAEGGEDDPELGRNDQRFELPNEARGGSRLALGPRRSMAFPVGWGPGGFTEAGRSGADRPGGQ